jgi:serine/threonine protein kinase
MTFMRGVRIGSYEIISPIGRGIRGEIYIAKDSKLDRNVAIKVLREELATDPERFRRFELEARAASALGHPNIITVYDIGEHNARPFIAMEHLEGQTLREILAEGALLNKELLDYATQVAEGIAEAHTVGIVHRNLKPENLLVADDDLVKILDFGLAQLTADSIDSQAETSINGYLSPEQAAGGEVEYRSDQFSFGTLLYEMATGKEAFRRETAKQTRAAILEAEPEPITGLNPEVPSELTAVVERCLAKQPGERYDSTQDLARELASFQKSSFTALLEMLRGFKRHLGAT